MMSFAVVTIVKATLVCGAAFFLSRLCGRARASIRHLLFALAFAALVAVPAVGPVVPAVAVAMPPVATSSAVVVSGFSRTSVTAPSSSSALSIPREMAPARSVTIAQVVTSIWLAGVALFLAPVVAGLWQVRRLRQSALTWTEGQARMQTLAAAMGVHQRIDALLHDAVTGPMTCCVLRPSIILPVSAREWDEASLRRALRHELEHIARWDFLTLCLSRIVCAAYWFHPLVWAAWRRLRLEAERACDDAVVREDDARDYASLLVSMAQRGPADGRRPLLAMAGRDDLSARVAAVLDDDQARGRIGRRRAAALIVIAAIAMLGVAPITVAREVPQAPAFADVSIRRNPPPQIMWRDGRLVATNVTARELLRFAFGVDIDNGPWWVNAYRFDVVASMPSDNKGPEQGSKSLQSFLAERFKLVAHRGSKDFPVYAVVVARQDGRLGPQMTRSQMDCNADAVRARAVTGTAPPAQQSGERPSCGTSSSHGRLTGRGITLEEFARNLPMHVRFQSSSQFIGRQVMDRTGLSGRFDFTLEWTPDTAAASSLESSPRFLAALEEQLGLKIESQLAPKPVLVIDSIEQPAEN
jgi:bla regulator protein blaR1